MKYNFDQIIAREATKATKSYVPHVVLNHPDSINLWVADMDFPVCQEVVDALKKRVDHPIFGYGERGVELRDALRNWYARRHDIHFQNDDVVLNTGVIHGYSAAVRILTDIDDEIIVPIPAYAPFLKKIAANHRKALLPKMKSPQDHYALDFAAMEQMISEKTKVFVLCNPHNPTGRVYTKAELLEIAQFCEKHQLRIISDEIHCDIVYQKFTSIMDINDYTRNNTIVLCSIGKTFNLAGLKMGSAIIKNPQLREAFRVESECVGNTSTNCLAEVAYQTAYQYGDEWLDQCLAYIKNNIDWTISTIHEHFPDIPLETPQGTYFVWLDLRQFHIETEDIQQYFLDKADVYVTQGEFFSESYREYIRLNMATPFANVQKGVLAICDVLHGLSEKR